MKNNKSLRTCLLVAAVLLLLALILFLGYRYLALRVQANITPPQVLIHRPTNHDEISLTNAQLVHATARAEGGVARIELWVDGKFISAQDAPESGAISPLVIHTFWQPQGAGTHEIVVRAIDTHQIEGVGSILVAAIEPDEIEAVSFDPLGYEEGDEIPADMGTSGNPPQPAAGGDNTPAYNPAGSSPPPPADESPPEPANEITEFTFQGFLFGFLLGEGDEAPTDNPENSVILTLEGLGLETDRDFEGVHCYVGLGDRTPGWFPDEDNNQTTDENFALTGDRQWNVAEYLSEENGVTTAWPNNQPIPFQINCIGTTGGGTQAVDLGRAEVSIPPGEWDGITRSTGGSAEGSFTFAYRVTLSEPAAKELDPTIPVPYNLRIDDRRQELVWDWDNEAEGNQGVVGFLIYVNDILVFTADSRQDRAARIPYTWFNPPCRMEYKFTVRAHKHPYPDGDYSSASEPVYLPDPDGPVRTDCAPEFIIDFHTLVTGELQGDDVSNNWANSIRSVTGSFFANGDEAYFQGLEMYPNQTYDLNGLAIASTGSDSRIIFEPTPGENVRVGFDIAKYVGWDGFRDICTTMLFHDYSFEELMSYGFFEDTLYSSEDDGTRCQVHYTIRPMDGTPFGSSNPNFLPLPWLDVVGLSENPGNGNLRVHVRNTGSAPWANLDLNIRAERRGSAGRDYTYIVNDLYVEVGETKFVVAPWGVDDMHRYCIILDQNNEVLEFYENTGALSHEHMRYCLPQPDLRLDEVQYDVNDNVLRMHIWNTGDPSNELGNSDFDLADLTVRIEPEGEEVFFYSFPGHFAGQTLPRNGDAWVEWEIQPGVREHMLGGYTVRLDPEDDVSETNEDNNTAAVRGGTNLRIGWNGMGLRWYPNPWQECPSYGRWATNSAEVWVTVSVQSEFGSRSIASWHWDDRVRRDYHTFLPAYGWDPNSHTTDVYVNGEESIVLAIRGKQSTHDMGSATSLLSAEHDWEIQKQISSTAVCNQNEDFDTGYQLWAYPTRNGWSYCGGWAVYFNICEITD